MSGEATPADPGAIDIPTSLVIAQGVADSMEKYPTTCTPGDAKAIRNLIATVEALRVRVGVEGLPCACRFRGVEGAIRHGSETGVLVDPDEPIRECALHKALRARVVELEAIEGDHIIAGEECLKGYSESLDRAEIAEAGLVALAGALERQHAIWNGMADGKMPSEREMGESGDQTRAVLAATPAQAIERAKAVEECITALRHYGRKPSARKALATLDALGKE